MMAAAFPSLALATAGLAWWLTGSEAFVLVRLLGLAVVMLALTASVRRDGRAVLLSPPALLAAQVLVLYSLLPWALSSLHAVYMVNTHAALATYFGSRAEALAIGFASLLAALRVVLPPLPCTVARAGFLNPVGEQLLAVVGLTATALFLLLRMMADVGAITTQLRDGMLPIALTAGAILHLHLLDEPRRHRRLLAVAAVVVLLLLISKVGKPLFYAMGAAFLWWLLASPLSAGRRLRATAVVGVLGIVALVALAFIRDRGFMHRVEYDYGGHEPFRMLTEKVVDRQLETGWCFANLLDDVWPAGEGSTPFYFAAAVVPRVLWPDKPSLSVGHELGVRYCAKDPQWLHSASVTLLGEPVLKAGAVGLAVAVAFTLAALAGVSVLGARLGPAGLGLWIGLTPWLVDFDQTFAMYVANGTKCLLYAVPVLILAHRFRNREKAACAA